MFQRLASCSSSAHRAKYNSRAPVRTTNALQSCKIPVAVTDNCLQLGMSSTAAGEELLQQARPASGIQVATNVVHSVLGTSLPLSQITQVRMHVVGKCKMGISFWPRFRFHAPDREAQPGSVKLVHQPPAPAAAAAPEGSPSSVSSSGGVANAVPSGGQDIPQQQQPVAEGGRELLHISFTQDPPDEFNVGARFLGGIPFPFITIRTNKLEGYLDPETGALTLLFEASFIAQVGKRAPTCLPINATLTTEPASAYKASLEGSRIVGGRGMLVSAAEVPKTPNWFANLILWLPTAATAKLPVRFEFS